MYMSANLFYPDQPLLRNILECLHTHHGTNTHIHKLTQGPQLTTYKSSTKRWLTVRKTPVLSMPTDPYASLLHFLTAFFYDSTQYVDVPPTLLCFFPHSFLLPHFHSPKATDQCQRDYDNGDFFVLGICVSLTC